VRFKARNTIRLSAALLLLVIVFSGYAKNAYDGFIFPTIVTPPKAEFRVLEKDTTDLPFPLIDQGINPTENGASGVNLQDPDNINSEVVYDPETGTYQIIQTIGDSLYYRTPVELSQDEFLDYDFRQSLSEYWNEQQENLDEEKNAFAPKMTIESKGFKDIFGSSEIEIRPQGSAELSFGVNVSQTDNPRIPERQRRITTFDFDQRIQLNVVGNIGTKLQLSTNYNTEATFDFENQMKLEYTGDEDEIIQKIEAGNVSLPLSGSLIQGSQSLFGVKLETKFGRLRNTTVLSQQKGERKEITVEGGAQTQTFDVKADSYEANRHFFLSQYFRDQYDVAMQSLPVVNSNVNITRIEVWVVNTQANTQDVRNLVAFSDLGENGQYQTPGYNNPDAIFPPSTVFQPDNSRNNIYDVMVNNEEVLGYSQAISAIQGLNQGFQQGIHYERVGNARMLSPSEFTYNSRLGFVSLRQALNNAEVLAVAYEYTQGGETFQVGSLSQDGITAPSALILKMLKSSITQVVDQSGEAIPLWDLMMKNVYSLGAFGVNSEDFRLDVWYNNPATGIFQNYIPRDPLDGKLLVQVLDMDKINVNGEPYPDGLFDFVDNAATQGGLINSQNGRIYLPTVEPFGDHLANYIRENGQQQGLNENEINSVINSVTFTELYDSTKTAAQQIPTKNRFSLRGQYKSSSSNEISLNSINIPQGSVSVMAGGIRLVENQDYTVDYNLGRVRIINDALLDSGTPINVSLESNSLFNIQTRSLLGSRFDYEVSEDINIGATILNLRERPLTQKINIGDEPVNNTIVGADVKYRAPSRFITSLVDKLPFYETKAESTIDFNAEAAYLIPGYSRAIGQNGNAYIDDFEGSQSTIDLRALNQWFLASTPRHQPDLFPEALTENDLKINYNRAKMSWYQIDPIFYQPNANLTGVDEQARSDHRMREILEEEVFPNRELAPGTPRNIATLDVSYYPEERGQYNYDLMATDPNLPPESAGLTPDGLLEDPQSRWGGIQRALTVNDFEQSNIEFIQFWLMDPFNEDSPNDDGGDLYFNLGNVSEDVLSDSGLSFENGYPSENQPNPVDSTIWGFIPDPSNFNVVNAFDNSAEDYDLQDIGIDGLTGTDESDYFENEYGYISALQNAPTPLNQAALAEYIQDLSADDYQFPRRDIDGDGLNTLDRHKDFNGYDGNALNQQEAATTIPNTEDINRDNTLNTIESYYQYKVSLRPEDLTVQNIGNNYLTDVFQTTKNTDAQSDRPITWYQFKIPVRDFDRAYNGITDFRSIRFLRMFMKDWEEEVTLRFARLELIRGEWRVYLESLEPPGEIDQTDDDETTFAVNAVNIEENSNREPIRYVEPPGIIREIDVGAANLRNLNEQSLSIEVCNLKDGDSRATYRNVNYDMRLYERLKMFIHAESADFNNPLEYGDMACFLRLGSDFDENYYEYEIPLTPTALTATAAEEIWPDENIMDIELQKLLSAKQERDNSGANKLTVYESLTTDGDARIRIKGNPNLANVATVMIGLRNPDMDNNPYAPDDGLPECAVVWANELRLTDFNNQGGGAALATLSTTLADFGNLALAGSISTPGFGSLEQRIQERQRETRKTFDASTTLQMGKLFGENLGVQLPVYMGYSINAVDPQFDPLSPDIVLTQGDYTPTERRDRLDISRDLTVRRNLTFSNVRINPKPKDKEDKKDSDKGKDDKGGKADSKGGGKGKAGGKGGSKQTPFYSVKNFSVSYSYSDIFNKDVDIENDLEVSESAGLNYAFSYKPLEVKPFAKLPLIKDAKSLKFIKDFNFNIGPKQVGFNTTMNRNYRESRLRDNTALLFGPDQASDVIIPDQVVKNWNWNRQYTFRYDLTKSLKFDFSANNQALIREPQGTRDLLSRNQYRDSLAVLNGFGTDTVGLAPGITTNYNHSANLNYKLPLDKFPLINFISADTRYGSTYTWARAPFSQDSLGNTIQNTRNISVNAQANFATLYNKSDFLKALSKGKKPKKKEKEKEETEEEVEVDGFGNEIENEKKKKKKEGINPLHELIKVAMMVKNVSGSYARNEGTFLPGYDLDTYILGMDRSFQGPGLGFLAGQQDKPLFGNGTTGLYEGISDNFWLVQQENLNIMQNSTFSENFNFRANIEPFKDVKIELNMNKQYSENTQSFFVYDPTAPNDPDLQALDITDQDGQWGDYIQQSPNIIGNYSASIIAWPTSFIDGFETADSEVFGTFLRNRIPASERVSQEYDNETGQEINGYFTGYGPLSQRVVIPSFVAAYTGRDINSVSTDPLDVKMAPNWSLRYNGLTKIKSLKKIFKQFRISHSYTANYTTSFVTNVGYEAPLPGENEATDQAEFENYVDPRQISTVSIVEQLSPLLGFDMTLNKKNKNKKPIDPQIKVEIRRDRTVTLGLANFQITETKSKSFIIGIGGKIPEVPISWLRSKRSRLPGRYLENSPINIRADLTIRDNFTVIRRIEEEQNQITAGQRIFSLKTSADLQVSDKLTVRFFYDHQITEPKISTSFRTSNVNSGISLRFTLTQ